MRLLRGRLPSTTLVILTSFFLVILLGAVLLSLPISAASGKAISFVDALFTATSATCVTGLVVFPTVTTFSAFGQVVLLLLIQIGGLGVITVLGMIAVLLNKRLGLFGGALLRDAFNLNSLSGLLGFLKRVVLGTLLIELLGALCYLPVFLPEFGVRGVWIAVFTAVSAFCNAGIDIIATDSLVSYVTNPLVNTVTSVLIVLGGLGFIVWWDVLRVLKKKRQERCRFFQSLTLHSRIVLVTTGLLIFLGAAAFFLFEYNNPSTMQGMSLPQKIGAALFQSITTRTAGFATIPQENFTNASAFVSLFLMFIGGSPVGTAGGIKTVTVAVLFATMLAVARNQNHVSLQDRYLPREAVYKAVAVAAMSFATVFFSTVLLAAVTEAPALDILYETVSATATVGLSRNFTASLGTAGKLIITFTMYCGRVGPISIALLLGKSRQNRNIVQNPTEDVSVG